MLEADVGCWFHGVFDTAGCSAVSITVLVAALPHQDWGSAQRNVHIRYLCTQNVVCALLQLRLMHLMHHWGVLAVCRPTLSDTHSCHSPNCPSSSSYPGETLVVHCWSQGDSSYPRLPADQLALLLSTGYNICRSLCHQVLCWAWASLRAKAWCRTRTT
jgi:hypothetical protein